MIVIANPLAIRALSKPESAFPSIKEVSNTLIRIVLLIDIKVFRHNNQLLHWIKMPKVTRIGVSFPPELLKDFDDIIEKMGYESRSKAIQDAVRLYVSERKWVKEGNIMQTGVILMVYNHETRGLESDLTEAQHHHTDLISSTMHIHLGEHDCLEVIAVKGKGSEIRHLSDELATRRGVKILKSMIVSV